MNEEKERIIRLKEAVVKELIRVKEMKMVFRPENVKFHENEAILLAHLNSYHDLTIGDAVSFKTPPRWLNVGQFIWFELSYGLSPDLHITDLTEYFIGAFFEMNGHIKDGNQIKDIFCALIIEDDSQKYPRLNVFKIKRWEKDLILLFWAEGLQRIERSK